MSDFLDDKKREIHDRIKELKPLVDEYHRLEAAAAALDSTGGRSTTATTTRTRRARTTTGTRRRPGRRKGSGTRAAQALSFVQSQPGITIPDLAEKMGIKQNYLYRVLPGLEGEGKVRKDGRGWYPAKA